MQQFPNNEKTDSKEEVSCLKKLKKNGRRKVCTNIKTDANKFSFVMGRHRNNFHLKVKKTDLILA